MAIIKTPTGSNIRDRTWIRRSFMLAEKDISDRRFRLQTLATQKFTDTRLGGNFTINNLPQYTRTADIRISGLNAANQILSDTAGTNSNRMTKQNVGMGRFYSEQIDDNSQQVFLQFGVPEYNGMFSFFTGFYDNDAALLANEGLATVGYYAGFAIGLVVSLAFAPIILLGGIASFFLARPTSRYYYMRETMPLYWNRVNTITNSIAVNMGLVPRIHEEVSLTKVELEAAPDSTSWRDYAHSMAPDIFRPNGGIDIYAVANRAQRLADKRYRLERELFSADNLTDLSVSGIYKRLKNFITGDYGTVVGEGAQTLNLTDDALGNRAGRDPNKPHIHAYLQQYHQLAIGNKAMAKSNYLATATDADISQLTSEQSATASPQQAQQAAATPPYTSGLRDKFSVDKSKPVKNQDPDLVQVKGYGETDGFMDYWTANQREGSAFVGFRVDHVSSVQESFSTSTKESDIANKINGISGNSRNLRFSFSDGNTGFGLVDGAINAAKGVAAGFLDSVHMSGLMSLAGSAWADIPLQVAESSASFPTSSYTIELRAPYGHVLSRFMNLHVPLACLLAGALPLSTGKQSYTTPFLCSLYCKGKNQIRLGVIDSLSITRGAGNLGFNNNGECLGIDISFSVKDLSNILHVPIDAGFNPLKPWKGMLFDDDSTFKDYMAVLSNLSLADQTYPFRKMILNLTRKREQIDTFFSKAHFAMATSNNFLTRWPGTIYGIATRAGDFTIQ